MSESWYEMRQKSPFTKRLKLECAVCADEQMQSRKRAKAEICRIFIHLYLWFSIENVLRADLDQSKSCTCTAENMWLSVFIV
jgi:hypothetical protein